MSRLVQFTASIAAVDLIVRAARSSELWSMLIFEIAAALLLMAAMREIEKL